MLYTKQPKVFCIGLNKTGTSSLHYFFNACGLNSKHNSRWVNYSHITRLGKYYFRHQCYTDGEQPSFTNLDKWFPGSVFILNTRDEREWLHSRVKHALGSHGFKDLLELYTQERGLFIKELLTDESLAIQKWLIERRLYHKRVEAYFDGRKDFIKIDITNTEDWIKQLHEFLSDNGFILLNAPKNAIHDNKRHVSEINDQNKLKEYLALTDEILDGFPAK